MLRSGSKSSPLSWGSRGRGAIVLKGENVYLGEAADSTKDTVSAQAASLVDQGSEIASDVYDKAVAVASDVHDTAKDRVVQEVDAFKSGVLGGERG
jgi:hypothetical protein